MHARARKGGVKRQNDLYQGAMPQLADTHIRRPLISVGIAGSLSPSLLMPFFSLSFSASLFLFLFFTPFSLARQS
jgi:hypothetical protein